MEVRDLFRESFDDASRSKVIGRFGDAAQKAISLADQTSPENFEANCETAWGLGLEASIIFMIIVCRSDVSLTHLPAFKIWAERPEISAITMPT